MNADALQSSSGNAGRLKWRCRRGMRELDEAMLAYLNGHYVHASADEQLLFEELIDMQDPELFGLVSGKSTEARYQPIIDKMAASMGAAAKKD
ncbi:MAG: succinate dehydrogenase assembly factor 2 [Granulosicoccus sp.]